MLLTPFVLNDPPPPETAPAGGEAGEALQRAMLGALGAFTTAEGRVDYDRLRASAELGEAVERARRLQGVDLARLGDRAARLAFWINVYNALVLHGVIALGVRRSVGQVWNFFGRVRYRIGGFTWSADDVEHGVLRGNRRWPFSPSRPFSRDDARLVHALDALDPRFHFALTCGARSCPPVGVYRAELVDAQLDLAARSFVNAEVGLDPSGRIRCSKLFKWYGGDFDAAGGLSEFLLRYLDEGPARAALAAGARPCRSFRRYEWALQHPPVE